jgi:tRNA A-37 threonylcarbamoyl transferase component Bud32
MPQRLGRYVVRRRIGNGAFATVWLAYDEHLDSPVAVKVLADNWTEDAHIRKRFQEEGRYLRKVESPHVVSVYDAGELDDGRPYLVMSYADQGTLADRLEVEGLTVAQAMEVVRQVGAGLQALHDRDIVHRDVKPANVLFRSVDAKSGDTTVRAMVGDLGLGRALDMSSRLTMVAGTPSYVAPEQARAEAPDARADQYSLAALAFMLLAGRPPYSHTSLLDAGHPGPLPSVSTDERPYSPDVDAALHRGLAPDREDRYPSVTAFVTALQDALGSELDGSAVTETWLPVDPDLTQPGPRPTADRDGDAPPVSTQTPSRRRARNVLVAAVVGLLGLGLGGAGGYAVQQSLEEPQDPTLVDDSGMLQVTVPAAWTAVADNGWTPPNTTGSGSFPALSVGGSSGWANDPEGHGVFVALLPGEEIPEQSPQHPECEAAGDVVEDEVDDSPTRTVTYSGCPGGYTIERVTQVAGNRLLWVQIRSDDRRVATRVLASVTTSGL